MAEQVADSRIIFSLYVENLEETAKVRYNEKLAMLGGAQDPYLTINIIKSTGECVEWFNWPNVEYPDIFNYFVTSVSSYTKQQLKAYKSLEGYKYFIDGWINEIVVWSVPSEPNACVVYGTFGQLNHSTHSPGDLMR